MPLFVFVIVEAYYIKKYYIKKNIISQFNFFSCHSEFISHNPGFFLAILNCIVIIMHIYIYIYIYINEVNLHKQISSFLTIFKNLFFSLCIPINFNQTAVGLF